MSRKNLNKNAISAFEEYGVQHRQTPKVEVVGQSGPPHKPIFWAIASLGSMVVWKEKGQSKHEARIKAAERALQQLYIKEVMEISPGSKAKHELDREDKQVKEYEGDDQEDDDTTNPIPYKDPVSALMEYSQSAKEAVEFVQISQEGPPHMPIFTMEAHVGETVFKKVSGASTKETKKKAACVVLNTLKRSGELQKLFPDAELLSSTQMKSKGALALPGKNPVSVLNEYAQKNCVKLQFISKHNGPSHKPIDPFTGERPKITRADYSFSVTAVLGDEEFETVTCPSKKEGNVQAAEAVLAILADRGLYRPPVNEAAGSPSAQVISRADRMAQAVMKRVGELFLQTPESLVGRKVIAAIVMTNDSNNDIRVISIGTGNRCIKGSLLCDDGTRVLDSHAEILAIRGFKRFLYWLLETRNNEFLMPYSSGRKRRFRDNISFHLYISTAPCGDGALFSHNDQQTMGTVFGSKHQPCFSNTRTQGLLRAKQENGEGTIPIDPEVTGQSFDGVQQGDRLKIMSCSDKICLWNVVGLQGSLLSTMYDPIYMKSIILGALYNPGHLTRAICCRIDHTASPLSQDLPRPMRVNHPDVGVSSLGDTARAVEKARPLSINWSYMDDEPEVTDGTTGLRIRTMKQPETPSRLCKKSLLQLYQKHAHRPGMSNMTYKQLKLAAVDYNQGKIAFKSQMDRQGFGKWIAMPREVDRF